MERVDAALTAAMDQYANESPSLTGNLIRQTFYRIRSFGFKLPSSEPRLPDMPPVSADPQPLFVHAFHNALFERCRFAQLRQRFDSALEFLIGNEKKIHDAGWPRRYGVHLDLLKAWAVLRSGKKEDAYTAVAAVGSDPEANVRVWSAATTLAASFPDQTAYIQLRRDGIARFASDVEGEDAFHFCSAVLLRPLSEDLVEIVRRVLDRVERFPATDNHWITLFAPAIRGALAVRTGDFEAAIRELDDYEKTDFDSNFGGVAGQARDIAWGWRMTRALALAQVGRNESALSAYQDAIAIRQHYSRVSMDIYGLDDVWMREAEQVLQTKGILKP